MARPSTAPKYEGEPLQDMRHARCAIRGTSLRRVHARPQCGNTSAAQPVAMRVKNIK